MAIKKHVFISSSGDMLPRWKQAFSKSVVVTASQNTEILQADFIWLRLQAGMSAEAQIKSIRSHNPNSALIVLSDIPDDDEAMVVFSLAARGYANSHAAADTLKQIAKVVEQGGLWIGPSLMQRLLTGISHLPQTASPKNKHKLTDREIEVGNAIAAGASNKEVARQLNITERTVKAHVSGLFTKLAVSDRLQLALKMREISR